jgi:hypothetical protein
MGTKFGLWGVKVSLRPQKSMKRTGWFIFFLILAASCLDDPDCFQLNNNFLGISFYVMGSGGADTLKATEIVLSGAKVVYADTATSVSLPLNYTTTTTNIIITRADGSKDTLNVTYDAQMQYVSEDCGSRYILGGLAVTEHSFDSIRVVSDVPTKSGGTNIAVYRCPEITTMGFTLQQLYISGTTTQSATTRSTAINSITADFSGEKFYVDQTASTLYLPVNLADVKSSYTFDFADDFGLKDSIRKFVVNYKVHNTERYKRCGTQKFVDSLVIDKTQTTFDTAAIALDSDDDALSAIEDPAVVNVKLLRCPETNLTQIVFRRPNTTTTRAIYIQGITMNYADDILYAGDTTSTVKLPLNPNASSTEFQVKYTTATNATTVTTTIAVSYTVTFDTLFPGCGVQNVYSDLVKTDTSNNVEVLTTNDVKFPAVTNIAVEVD